MTTRECILFITIAAALSGCSKKEESSSKLPMENTTELSNSHSSPYKNTKEKDYHAYINKSQNITIKQENSEESEFILKDMNDNKFTFSIENTTITCDKLNKPMVLFHIFSKECAACMGEIPYLSDLQKKYKQKLFVAGILVNDAMDNGSLQELNIMSDAKYFVSNSHENNAFATKLLQALHLPADIHLPLTILYYHGKYTIHYEGATPIEMISHNIQSADEEK